MIIRIPTVKFKQANVTLFIGNIKASELCAVGIIDSWDSPKGWDIERQGYQRESYKTHYKGIAKFLKSNPKALLPTSVVLSARASEQGILEFRPLQGTKEPSFGYLEVPEGYPLYIVDGQHRMQGFRYAIDELGLSKLGDFLVPVVIIYDVNKIEELTQFHLINDRQKRISTNLALALLGTVLGEQPETAKMLVGSRVWKIKGIAIAIELNADRRARNQWKARIALPNEPKDVNTTATLSSFVGSLAPFFSEDFPIKLSNNDIRKYLVRFWSALSIVMPQPFVSPKEYVVQKTTGMYSLNRVAAELLRHRKIVHISSDQAIANILKKDWTHMVATKWRSSGEFSSEYRGNARFRELAQEILLSLI